MSGTIIAPNGSPLNTAIIGVDDLDLSLEFYRDLIGLSTEDPFDWSGKEFEEIWHLPQGSSARGYFCELKDCDVGRILLLDFKTIICFPAINIKLFFFFKWIVKKIF